MGKRPPKPKSNLISGAPRDSGGNLGRRVAPETLEICAARSRSFACEDTGARAGPNAMSSRSAKERLPRFGKNAGGVRWVGDLLPELRQHRGPAGAKALAEIPRQNRHRASRCQTGRGLGEEGFRRVVRADGRQFVAATPPTTGCCDNRLICPVVKTQRPRQTHGSALHLPLDRCARPATRCAGRCGCPRSGA